MAVSESHKRSSYKWNSSRDNIMIRPTKAEGATIRAAAEQNGLSVQQLILKCVRETLGYELEEEIDAGQQAVDVPQEMKDYMNKKEE